MVTPNSIPKSHRLYLTCKSSSIAYMKRLLKRTLPIGLAIGLLLYALKDSSLAAIGNQFRQANYGWLLFVGFQIGLYNIVRAARWQLTLQAIGYQPPLLHTTVAMLAGTMASMIIPGAGELTRCGTLQRTDGIPMAQCIGSVIAERVIDFFMLLLLIGLTLLLEFKRLEKYVIDIFTPAITQITQSDFSLAVWAGAVLLLTFVMYWVVRHKMKAQHRITSKLTTFLRNMGQGVMSIANLKRPVWFIFLTFISYILIYSATYSLFFSSTHNTKLPPVAALSVITVSSLGGLAVPTQGGIGTFHYLVSRVLLLYGVPKPENIAIATFMHAVQTSFALLFSSISFLSIPSLVRHRTGKETLSS